MDSRERYIRALTFNHPDRAPHMHRAVPGAFRRYGSVLDELYARYPSDVLLSPTRRSPFNFWEVVREDSSAGHRIVDDWGCVWEKLSSDHQGQVVEHPLDHWDRWASYKLPDPRNGSQGVEELVQAVRDDQHRHYVMATVQRTWERILFLRGFENACIDIAERNGLFLELCDAIIEYNLARIDIWAKHKDLIDGILLTDDWGTQQSLMISPESWRRIFKPRYRRLVEAVHDIGAYAHLHSDGNTHAIVGDLIEIGFDEINPQMSCMDVSRLGREAGGRVCVRADIDRQWTLPFGTPADVERHVRTLFEHLGCFEGGYVGYGQINTDVPLENAEAMLRTISQLTY